MAQDPLLAIPVLMVNTPASLWQWTYLKMASALYALLQSINQSIHDITIAPRIK